MPVIGVIEPGADAACRISKSGHIAVIGTEGTVRGGAYQEAIHRLRPDARVNARSTQLFVALAEEGMHEGPIAEAVARHYLDALFDGPATSSAPRTGPDTLVLGCTHFPMLAGAIRAAIGPLRAHGRFRGDHGEGRERPARPGAAFRRQLENGRPLPRYR